MTKLLDGCPGDAGVHEIGKRLSGGSRVWMAAEYQSRNRRATEISQLLYHLQVLMLALDLTSMTYTSGCNCPLR